MNIDRFKAEVSTIVDKSRVYTDELRRLAWGTDAGFYKFMPQVILRSKDEGEVSAILKAASKYNVPVTFRAAGTSLSGQSVTDSVLVVAGKNWEQISTRDEGMTIRLQPGVIGSKVNDFLSGYGRKFGPDPASIKSAIVGSEGTLGFLSEVLMNTLKIAPLQANAMVYFKDIAEAARAVITMRPLGVSAAEMLDKRSLSSVNAAKKATRTIDSPDKVVYFPSCLNQTMGTDKASKGMKPLAEEMVELMQKAGYQVIFPKDMDSLCTLHVRQN